MLLPRKVAKSRVTGVAQENSELQTVIPQVSTQVGLGVLWTVTQKTLLLSRRLEFFVILVQFLKKT